MKRARYRPESKRDSTSFDADQSAITLVDEEQEAKTGEVRFIDFSKVKPLGRRSATKLRIMKPKRKTVNVYVVALRALGRLEIHGNGAEC